MENIVENQTCPACGGNGAELGILGTLQHFRCVQCGAEFSVRADGQETTRTRKGVTLYAAQFKGVYGRNRKPKFCASKLVEKPAGNVEEEGVFCAGLAGDYCIELKVKHGAVRVVAYEDCEVSTYTDHETGRVITTQTWALYGGRTVVHQVINANAGGTNPPEKL